MGNGVYRADIFPFLLFLFFVGLYSRDVYVMVYEALSSLKVFLSVLL